MSDSSKTKPQPKRGGCCGCGASTDKKQQPEARKSAKKPAANLPKR